MIELKESYGFGVRLYDTKTGKYVPNNADNRLEAMYGYLVKNEIDWAMSGAPRESVYSIEELTDKFKYILAQFNGIGNLTKDDTELYLSMLDNHLACENLLKNENFVKLSLCVLKDQQDKKTMAFYSDIDKLEEKYKSFDEKIFSNIELNEEL